jgi:hypothetical protein
MNCPGELRVTVQVVFVQGLLQKGDIVALEQFGGSIDGHIGAPHATRIHHDLGVIAGHIMDRIEEAAIMFSIQAE